MALTEEQINAEKAAKSRPDLVPPRFNMAAGRALGYGARKHGLGRSGVGTYRDAGTEQALLETHVASFERHWQRFKMGRRAGIENPIDEESGLTELDCAAAQFSIIVDLTEDPPVAAPTPAKPSNPLRYDV